MEQEKEGQAQPFFLKPGLWTKEGGEGGGRISLRDVET